MRNFLWALCLLGLAQAVVADTTYKTYHNARFNFSIGYPDKLLYPQGESDNGDGQKFLSKNADASLIVYGAHNALEQSLEALFLEAARSEAHENPNKVVTYRILKQDWFVVSGYQSGKVFYKKTILHGDMLKSFYFEYPENQKGLYDPIVKYLSQSFKG